MAGGVRWRMDFDDINTNVTAWRADIHDTDITTKTITDITQANPGVVTSNSHGFSNGDIIFIDGIVGMTEVNKTMQTVANVTANTYTIEDTSGFTAYTSDGTANASKEVDGWGNNPLRIKWAGEGSDKYGIEDEKGTVKSSTAYMDLKVDTENEYSDLFDGDEKRYPVWVYKDTSGTHGAGTFSPTGNLYWSGYIVIDNWREKYSDIPPYGVTVQAKDGLEGLKNVDFESSGSKITGRQSVLETIVFCLDQLNINEDDASTKLPILEAVNIYESQMPGITDAHSPLVQAYIDPEIYRTDDDEAVDCYTVLRKLCFHFGARLWQCPFTMSGETSRPTWWIVRVNQLGTGSTFARRLYLSGYTDAGGGQENADISFTPVVELDNILQTVREIEKAYKTIKTNFFAGEPQNWVKDGDFEEAAFTNPTTLANWAESAAMNILKINNNIENSTVALRLEDTSTSTGSYVESPITRMPEGDGATSNDFDLRFKWRIITTSTNIAELDIPIIEFAIEAVSIQPAPVTYYLDNDDGQWSTSLVRNTITPLTYNKWTDFESINFNLPNTGNSTAGSDGLSFDVKVRLYELILPAGWTGNPGIDFDRCIGTATQKGVIPIEVSKQTATIPGDMTYTPSPNDKEIELLHGDVTGFQDQTFSEGNHASVKLITVDTTGANGETFQIYEYTGAVRTQRTYTVIEVAPDTTAREFNDAATLLTALTHSDFPVARYSVIRHDDEGTQDTGDNITLIANDYDDNYNFDVVLGQAADLAIDFSDEVDNIDPVASTTTSLMSRGAFTIEGNVSGNWWEKGDSETDPNLAAPGTPVSFDKMWIESVFRNYGTPTKRHIGKILDLTGALDFSKVIHDNTYDNGVYFPFNGGTQNCKDGSWNAELIEMKDSDQNVTFVTTTKNAKTTVRIINADLQEPINQNIITSGIKIVEGTLSAAQIKGINTTPVVVIPAPGANKIIKVTHCVTRLNWNSVAFDAGHQLVLVYTGNTVFPTIVQMLETDENDNVIEFDVGGSWSQKAASPGQINSAVQWYELSDSTNGDSTVDYSIMYYIANV